MLRRLTASTWGNFGWLEVQLAEPVRVAAALVVVVGLAAAVARRGEAAWSRAAWTPCTVIRTMDSPTRHCTASSG